MLAKYLTSDVHSSERFEFWRDAVCDAFVRLGCTTDVKKGFVGHLTVKRYQDLSVSHVSGSSHEVFRRKRDIAKADENDFLLSLQMGNHSRLVQRANTATLQSMDFALYSSTDPYQLSLSQDFSQLVLQFPKAKLLSRLPNAEMLTGIRIDGTQPLSALVAKNIIELTQMIDDQPESAQVLVQESLLDMVAMALAANANSRVENIFTRNNIFCLGHDHLSKQTLAMKHSIENVLLSLLVYLSAGLTKCSPKKINPLAVLFEAVA